MSYGRCPDCCCISAARRSIQGQELGANNSTRWCCCSARRACKWHHSCRDSETDIDERSTQHAESEWQSYSYTHSSSCVQYFVIELFTTWLSPTPGASPPQPQPKLMPESENSRCRLDSRYISRTYLHHEVVASSDYSQLKFSRLLCAIIEPLK